MSIVIIGGHERMARSYQDICKEFNCKSKVFTKMPANMKLKIGSPDLVILLTNTVSHKMVQTAVKMAQKNEARVVRSHSSSSSALKTILAAHTMA